ncbi:hypothetical protein LCGC14_2118580 [marine sediment metagenome]|uniref:Uncharacterized protein n=1 Tax=marine sediment metagenome TaxID=412755 RepID=A0A0F9E4Y0_9ZZZZ
MSIAQQYLDQMKRLGGEATQGDLENEPNTSAGRVWVRSRGWRGILMDCEPIFRVRATGATRDEEHSRRAGDAALIVALHNSRQAVGRVIGAAEALLKRSGESTDISKERGELQDAFDDLPVEASDAD